jgi:hypothetical protein
MSEIIDVTEWRAVAGPRSDAKELYQSETHVHCAVGAGVMANLEPLSRSLSLAVL